MSNDITVISKTQRIIVDPSGGSISIINVGPMGPRGLTGAASNVDSILTVNGDILTRAAGVLAKITRANLAADAAFSALYQALDGDLTAIAALSTTTYGRSLLTSANIGALTAALAVDSGFTSRFEAIGRHALGWLASGNSAAKTTVGTTPLTLITTSAFAIAANRRVRWSFMCSGYGNTLGDQFAVKIYSAGGGTLICTENIEVTGAGRYMMPPLCMIGFDTPAASGSTTYNVTITQTAGSGTFTMANTATFMNHLTVEDVGPNP